MTTGSNATFDLAELNKEQTFGGIGTTKARDVPRIDMSGFEARKAEIADQLWQASTEIGFFQLVNHGIPQEQIDEAFTMAERFFALPHETKARYPLGKGTNTGWEYKSQVRPSTGTADQKGILSDHRAPDGGAVADRQRIARLQGDDARLRTRQLGAWHEGIVVLCHQTRFRA